MQHGPAVRRRKLGEELRSLRHASGLTSRDAARMLGWHQSKVSRIETGVSGVQPADVTRLLDAYGVDDARLRDLLATLAGSAGGGGTGWWHAYRGLIPPQYRDFISLESQARTARTLETSVVPGLLQTADYARAVTRASLDGLPMHAAGLTGGGAARPAGGAADRSAAAAECGARRGGAAARGRRVPGDAGTAASSDPGGSTSPCAAPVAAVLDGRLRHFTGPFVIFSFPNTSDLDVVVLDHLTSSLYLERKEDLEAYSSAFRTMQAHALSPEHSLDLIAAIDRGVQ